MTDPETVCVVGQGYVGLPLALAFDADGYDVVGYDVDERKIETLQFGTDPTGDAGDEPVADSDVTFTTDPTTLERGEYVLITVPTPVDELGNPNLEFVKSAGRTVGSHMAEGTTVVLESTVYPGVTREQLVPVLEERSQLATSEGFNVGYSPERLSPGDEGRGLSEVTKIVSGDTDETLASLAGLYESVVDPGVHRAPSIEVAEAAKVMENVQRDLNIALANELSIICDHLGVDTRAVLDAAGTKWNFHDYSPGLVGGHCVPVDPLYLAHGSERAGYSPNLILQGREVNEYMPKHVAELAMKGLNEAGKVLAESRLLALGLSYKPNVGDIRTSEMNRVIGALEEYSVEVVGFDPHADDDAVREEFGIEVQPDLSLDGFDGVVLGTPHDELASLDVDGAGTTLNDDPVLVDVMSALDEQRAHEAGFDYRTL